MSFPLSKTQKKLFEKKKNTTENRCKSAQNNKKHNKNLYAI